MKQAHPSILILSALVVVAAVAIAIPSALPVLTCLLGALPLVIAAIKRK